MSKNKSKKAPSAKKPKRRLVGIAIRVAIIVVLGLGAAALASRSADRHELSGCKKGVQGFITNILGGDKAADEALEGFCRSVL